MTPDKSVKYTDKETNQISDDIMHSKCNAEAINSIADYGIRYTNVTKPNELLYWQQSNYGLISHWDIIFDSLMKRRPSSNVIVGCHPVS